MYPNRKRPGIPRALFPDRKNSLAILLTAALAVCLDRDLQAARGVSYAAFDLATITLIVLWSTSALIWFLGVLFFRQCSNRRRDLEALQANADELRESEKKYRSLFEAFMNHLPAAAWIKDKDMRFMFTNKAYKTYLEEGFDPLSKTVYEIWSPETAEKIEREDRLVLQTARPLEGVTTLNLSGGRAAYHAAIKFPIPGADGKINIGGVGIDITERIQAEQELERSREMYRDLVESIDEVIFSLDRRGVLTYVSPSFGKSFGSAASEVSGMNLLALIHPEDLENVRSELASVERGGAGAFECRFNTESGDTKWGAVHIKPLYQDGRFAGARGFIMEITGRKEAEARASELSDQVRAFAANLQTAREDERTSISREIHDELGQDLTALKLGLSVVSRKLSDHGSSQFVRDQSVEIEKLYGYTDAMMAKVKDLVTRLRPEVLDEMGLPQAIRWYAEQALKRTGIKCKLHFTSARLKMDKEKATSLYRIFQEAFTNVMRHSGATRMDVFLTKRNGEVKLRVTDNGSGITDEDIGDMKSLGILGMRERAVSVGGSFAIGRNADSGSFVEVSLSA